MDPGFPAGMTRIANFLVNVVWTTAGHLGNNFSFTLMSWHSIKATLAAFTGRNIEN
jgi:hypothetical protein